MLEGLLNAAATGEISGREAECLAGWAVLEWARDVAVVNGGGRAALLGRPLSTVYRMDRRLRDLGLGSYVPLVGRRAVAGSSAPRQGPP